MGGGTNSTLGPCFDTVIVFLKKWAQVKYKKWYLKVKVKISRSQWPRRLRRRSAAASFLRLWVRIPPEAWMFVVCVVSCQVEISATG